MGNRRGMDDETGLKNCAEGLKQIMAVAEKNKVIVVMELLNSKVNHKDYSAIKLPGVLNLQNASVQKISNCYTISIICR